MDVKLQHNVTTVCPIGIPPSTDWETALRGSPSIEPESGGTHWTNPVTVSIDWRNPSSGIGKKPILLEGGDTGDAVEVSSSPIIV